MKFSVKTQRSDRLVDLDLARKIEDKLLSKEIKPNTLYHITIKEDKPIRGVKANRYYWGVILKTLALEFGYDQDEMHEVCKQKFLSTNDLELLNKNKEVICFAMTHSTTDLDSTEFFRYCELIRSWAASEFNVYIPGPNEMTEEMLVEISERYERRYS